MVSMRGEGLTLPHRMRLAQDAERRLVVHVPAAHLFFVRERGEEQGRRRLAWGQVGHVWRRGCERGQALRVREQLGVWNCG